MTPTNSLLSFPSAYAYDSDYVHKTLDELMQYAEENWSRGFAPLETLPAAWLNSFLYLLTVQAQATKNLCDSMYAELKNVITQAGLALDESSTTQLKTAIDSLERLTIANATTLGSVKSSTASWKIAVAADGTMSVNTTNASSSAGLAKSSSASWQIAFSDGVGTVNTTNASSSAGLAKSSSASWQIAFSDGVGTVNTVVANESTYGLVKSNSVNWGVDFSSGAGTCRPVSASTSTQGIVQLSNSYTSTSQTLAMSTYAGYLLNNRIKNLASYNSSTGQLTISVQS